MPPREADFAAVRGAWVVLEAAFNGADEDREDFKAMVEDCLQKYERSENDSGDWAYRKIDEFQRQLRAAKA